MPQQPRSKRLGLVLDLISREEEAERKVLGDLQARARQAETKVQELIDYQRQYQSELRDSGNQGKGPSAHLIQNYHVFISRLGNAIEQQEQQLVLLGQQLNRQRQKWQVVYQKKNNMSDYIASCCQSEQLIEAKKQQRDLDDSVYRRSFKHPDA